MGLIRPKKELKCLDTLGKQFEIIEFFFTGNSFLS